jgi:hypothetical protein
MNGAFTWSNGGRALSSRPRPDAAALARVSAQNRLTLAGATSRNLLNFG